MCEEPACAATNLNSTILQPSVQKKMQLLCGRWLDHYSRRRHSVLHLPCRLQVVCSLSERCVHLGCTTAALLRVRLVGASCKLSHLSSLGQWRSIRKCLPASSASSYPPRGHICSLTRHMCVRVCAVYEVAITLMGELDRTCNTLPQRATRMRVRCAAQARRLGMRIPNRTVT